MFNPSRTIDKNPNVVEHPTVTIHTLGTYSVIPALLRRPFEFLSSNFQQISFVLSYSGDLWVTSLSLLFALSYSHKSITSPFNKVINTTNQDPTLQVKTIKNTTAAAHHILRRKAGPSRVRMWNPHAVMEWDRKAITPPWRGMCETRTAIVFIPSIFLLTHDTTHCIHFYIDRGTCMYTDTPTN
jgi:hypothetical protein